MFRYRFFITVFPHVIALIYFNHHLIIECLIITAIIEPVSISMCMM